MKAEAWTKRSDLIILIHPPPMLSMSFDSLAPARLTPPGPTFGCTSTKVPTIPVVVNSSGFRFKIS
jgi:hypothetical protein